LSKKSRRGGDRLTRKKTQQNNDLWVRRTDNKETSKGSGIIKEVTHGELHKKIKDNAK